MCRGLLATKIGAMMRAGRMPLMCASCAISSGKSAARLIRPTSPLVFDRRALWRVNHAAIARKLDMSEGFAPCLVWVPYVYAIGSTPDNDKGAARTNCRPLIQDAKRYPEGQAGCLGRDFLSDEARAEVLRHAGNVGRNDREVEGRVDRLQVHDNGLRGRPEHFGVQWHGLGELRDVAYHDVVNREERAD